MYGMVRNGAVWKGAERNVMARSGTERISTVVHGAGRIYMERDGME